MSSSRRGLAVIGSAALIFGTITPAAQAETTYDPATQAKINILHINDFHGRINGTAAKVATVVEQQRAAEGAANTLFLSGGDNVGASLYVSSSQQDNPTIDALNAMGVEASAVGNHEFDRGVADLQGRLRERAQFPYLAANVTLHGAYVDKGYATFEVDGMTVGVIGAVTQETPSLTSPAGMTGVTFENPVARVNELADQLTDGKADNGEADVLIAEYHEGSTSNDMPTGLNTPIVKQMVTGTTYKVSAIFNGHTHGTYVWNAPAPAGSKQTTRPVIQAGSYGTNVAQLVLTVDRTTKVASTAVARNISTSVTVDTANAVVAKVAQIEKDAKAQADILGNVQAGTITADVTTAYAGGQRDDRANSSTLATMVATMYRDATAADERGGAEIGVVNSGGLRADLLYAKSGDEAKDGIVTVGEASSVQPFANNLWTIDLTAAQFKVILEQQWQRNADGSVPSRTYLQLGFTDNLEYTYDPTRAEGDRITGIWVGGKKWTTGTKRVAAPLFLISGGDNFRGFTAGTNAKDSGLVDVDAYIAWLKTNSPYSPDFSRRDLQVVSLPTTPIKAGRIVSFTVNKTDLTSLGSPVNKTLQIWRGTTLIGTYPVVDGTAKVNFPMPKEAAKSKTGPTVFRIVLPDSRTEVPFELASTKKTKR